MKPKRMYGLLTCVAVIVATVLNASRVAAQESNSESGTDVIKVENAFLKLLDSTTLSARIQGELQKLDVPEGTEVNVGDPLGHIGDRAAQLQLERARLALETARKKQASDIDVRLGEKKLAVARNEFDRAIAANQRIPNTYPARETERLQLVVDSLVLEVERSKYDREIAAMEVRNAEAEVRQAEELVGRHQIVSPVAGVVVSQEKRTGEWVEPGAPLLQIVGIQRLRIEGFIPFAVATPDLKGKPAKARITIDQDEYNVDGVVTFVSPESIPASGMVRVYLEIDNPQKMFRSGIRVEAGIMLHQ